MIFYYQLQNSKDLLAAAQMSCHFDLSWR